MNWFFKYNSQCRINCKWNEDKINLALWTTKTKI